MKIIIFGLTVSSSWGNGHATLWRGLCRALIGMGHQIEFFERDKPYYADNRDLRDDSCGTLHLYDAWHEVLPRARQSIRDADAVIVTSYCPDAVVAGQLAHDEARGICAFYDLDTPVTLSRLSAGERVDYIGPRGLSDFDLVLSFTGGRALDALTTGLGAKRVAPLYGHVDPDVHRPVPPRMHYQAALSYLGTYSRDRQSAMEELFVRPARRHPNARFLIGGAQYPQDFSWSPNLFFVRHLPPSEHAAFFSSSRLTLNLTRRSMAQMGWCPSGRLFEAAACGAALVSDHWEGLEEFFRPEEEVIIVRSEQDVLDALERSDAEIGRIAAAARERVLVQHTSAQRAAKFCELLEDAKKPRRVVETVEA